MRLQRPSLSLQTPILRNIAVHQHCLEGLGVPSPPPAIRFGCAFVRAHVAAFQLAAPAGPVSQFLLSGDVRSSVRGVASFTICALWWQVLRFVGKFAGLSEIPRHITTDAPCIHLSSLTFLPSDPLTHSPFASHVHSSTLPADTQTTKRVGGSREA